MSKIKFAKFCASGNDFIVIDNRRHIIPKPESKFAKRISQRKFSIGADGVLLLDKVNGRFRMRIFNPDGSEPEMCGNGARAFARFIYELGIARGMEFQKKIPTTICYRHRRFDCKNIIFQTKAGEIRASVSKKSVKIGMTPPEEIQLNIPVRIKRHTYTGHFINTGVPHLVVIVKDLKNFPVKEIGRKMRFHKRFMPRGTNVDFISVKNGKIFLRTYERGVEDETLACGTGAVASAVIGNLVRRIKKIPVKVMVKGGELKIYFKKNMKDVYLEGDARLVCDGSIKEEAYV